MQTELILINKRKADEVSISLCYDPDWLKDKEPEAWEIAVYFKKKFDSEIEKAIFDFVLRNGKVQMAAPGKLDLSIYFIPSVSVDKLVVDFLVSLN